MIGDYDGVADGDVAIHFNFRPDRARQLVMALGEPDFDEFDRGDAPDDRADDADRPTGPSGTYPVAFPPQEPATTLAEVLAEAGMRQLHVAETEKYAHVTYFFNGGREGEWEGEERSLVDSPRDVATYDEQPEMSAEAAARRVRRALGGRRLPVRDHQLRQPGHGRPHGRASRPRSSAIEAVDACLGEVVAAVHESGGACIVTADHGNAEQMLEPDGSPNTAHSLNPVPFVVTVDGLELARRRDPRRRRPDRRSTCSASTSRRR